MTSSTFSSRNLTSDQWNALPAQMQSVLDGSNEQAKRNLIWRSLLWIAKCQPGGRVPGGIVRTALRSLMDNDDLWNRIFVKNENGEGTLILGALIHHRVGPKGTSTGLNETENDALVRLISSRLKDIVFWARTRGGIGPYDGNPYTMNAPGGN